MASRCRAWVAGFLAAAGLAATPAFAQSHGSAVQPFGAKELAARPSMVVTAVAAPVTELDVPPPEASAIEAVKRANGASRSKRVEIGIGRETRSLAASRADALRWVPVAGGVAARWRVKSAGAAALRVGLAGTGMPAGLQLRFTGAGDGDTVYGPFDWSAVASADAPYWSPVLQGESALVEVFIPAAAAPRKLDLSIEYISHLFVSPSAPQAESLAKASGACQVDFVCRAPSDAALASAGRSVARMTFGNGTGGANTALCTGTLLNPTDNSFTPYFYSAAHCISTQASASTLTTHWFYETTTCGGSTISASYVQVAGGATLLYSSHPADATLLRLNGSPPATAIYSGWDAASVSSGTPLTAIHHPRGDPKKVSLGTAAGFDIGTSVIPTATGSFIVVNWNSLSTGTTEPGSSGSGIFSTAGEYRFRGGLTGGPSSCTASTADLYDLYSRLDQVYPSIGNFLNPTTSGCTYSLSPTSASVGAGGTSGSFSVTTGGSCTWSASSDASWLTTSSSGSGSGTVTYGVAANASTSARTGTITVGGQRFTVTQSGQASSGGSNAIVNGDFESGASGWTQSASGGDAIIRSNSSSAHAGSGYAWLGGYNNGTDTLYQDVTVPGGSPTLRFWYRITTTEGSGAWDMMSVSIVSPTTGATLQTLASFSNANATSGWTQSAAYDLSAYAGQRVRLRFHATTDFSNITDFRVDDVTLTSASAANHTALWWNASENGWGINVNHQGDIVFATLFTYDASGSPLWLVMSRGDRQGSSDTYSGALYRTTGPAFNANPFTPITGANVTQVGTMTLAFSGDSASLTYSVNGAMVTKSITKQVFGSRAAVCQGTASGRTSATNYQDLWWNPAENGWGINLTQQGDTIFATLFTYASNGQPLWLVMSNGARQVDGSYLGELYRTTGPAFNAQPFTPIGPGNVTPVGTMRLRFSNGTNGTLEYTYQGASVAKSITRQEFSSPLPLCQS